MILNPLKKSDINKQSWGNKAYNIALLKNREFPIPDAFIISNPTIEDFNIPENINIILENIKQIGGFPIAVRSSSSLEDLHGASFAGLYESFLDIQNHNDLINALKNCLTSKENSRIQTYLKEKSDIGKKENFNILIQKMINCKYAGVVFSIDPLSGKEEHIRIEACLGNGEKLVSGIMTPTTFLYNSFQEKLVEKKDGNDKVDLSREQLQELKNYTLKSQAFFGCPQDLEWAIDQNDKIWILQSRPITAISWRTDLGELTNADLKDGGVSARICTPMMFSLYNKVFHQTMNEYMSKIKLIPINNKIKWMSYNYGRVYWNAGETKKALLNIPGFNEKEFDEGLGIQKDYGDNGPRKFQGGLGKYFGLLPIFFALKKEYIDCYKNSNHFISTFEEIDHSYKEKHHLFHSKSDQDLYAEFIHMFNEYYFKTESNYFRHIFNNSNFQTEFKSTFSKIDKIDNQKTNFITLMSGLKNLSHIQVQKDLIPLISIAKSHGLESNELDRKLDRFLKKHYHHGDAELELMTPRWGEAPKRVKEILGLMLTSKNIIDPEKTEKSQEKNFLKEKEKYIKRINNIYKISSPLKVKKFAQTLERLRWFLNTREKLREFSTRSYYVVRIYLLELGGRLTNNRLIEASEDIFFLHIDELFEVLNKSKDYKNTIHNRKLFWEGYRDFDAPNEFGKGIIQTKVDQYITEKQNGVQLIQGTPCSSGKIKGRARVITNLCDANNIKENEILVTKFTDPGWTPVLGIVSAVVTEVGGVLSHAAVIGREYGIPAVLNIPNITQIIQTGQTIEVDGDSGTIVLYD